MFDLVIQKMLRTGEMLKMLKMLKFLGRNSPPQKKNFNISSVLSISGPKMLKTGEMLKRLKVVLKNA